MSTLEQIERFWSRVDIVDGDCWEWNANCIPRGYGQMKFSGRNQLAHRISYTINIGNIPIGAQVLHTCDNRKCCNPDHLWLGTNSDNVKDKVQKGRQYRRLSPEDIISIREDSRKQKEIAESFGIKQSTVSQIKSRKRWNHI